MTGPNNAASAPPEHATRKQLYELARIHDIEGRSAMSKEELRSALEWAASRSLYTPAAAPEPTTESDAYAGEAASRLEAFQRLAQRAGVGELVMLPRLLQGQDRRLHVRQTIREDNHTRIDEHGDEVEAKMDKLAGSLFAFFRGTALLFYRDMAGQDAWQPTVLTLGDVHPENYGVMPNADNVPIFSVNDFDEACYAPFTWDIKRGAVGFMIAAEEQGGHGRKKQRKIARRFVQGYIEGVDHYASEAGEQQHELRRDNAPPLIRKLLDNAGKGRAKWLAEGYLDKHQAGFRASKKLVPISQRRAEFQAIINRLIAENRITPPARAGDMRVKDIAIRKGQGTASLGLPRYYVLIEGPEADGTDDLIIELKRARRSALTGLTPPSQYGSGTEGARIVHAQNVQLVRGDVFYGSIELEGKSFLSRERAPFRDDIDLDELSKPEWKKYAAICGRILAHAHALSDETGEIDYDVEPKIREAMTPAALFVEDTLNFAEEASGRLRRDHKAFREDHALGAFRDVDVVYR